MDGVTRSSWHYAILLIILLATATLAVKSVLLNLETDILAHNLKHALNFTRIAIWSLTLGFMSMTGAFGLWAIRFGTIAETRQRIGRIVEAMDSIDDALLAVDHRGRTISANPALSSISGRDASDLEALSSLFPQLTREQQTLLTDQEASQEIEIEISRNEQDVRTYPFRPPPAPGMNLIFISDVTVIRDQQLRNRQSARLQLVGQIARGVANDFNNLLCGISGHASLLSHLNDDADKATADSLQSITQSAGRGISLAGHLMSLSTMDAQAAPALRTADHIHAACSMLQSDLSPDWTLDIHVQEAMPPTPMSGIQWEQVIYHLGFSVADCFGTPGTLSIDVRSPTGTDDRFDAPSHIAVIALITGLSANPGADDNAPLGDGQEGVIQSVVESVVSGIGGTLENLSRSSDTPRYRISIPFGHMLEAHDDGGLPDELAAYMSSWTVAVASVRYNTTPLTQLFHRIDLNCELLDSLISTLARIESDKALDVLVIERALLGDEADALLKAIVKLCPDAGLVVLTSDRSDEPSHPLENLMAFESIHAKPEAICNAMIRAKTLTAGTSRAS